MATGRRSHAGPDDGGRRLRAGPPGAPRDPELNNALWAAFEAKEPSHAARTQHFGPDGRPTYVNRLILEASPYLLQHAHNPVDWRPWGEGALAEAEAWDRPIFVSVGYATCHWCHVMEEESFDNEAVAQVLNAHFIPVKVDREQHPAIDQLYITATQLQQGHAGWPNSIFLMPDGRPFHTGTYFPRPHFLQLLQSVAQLWRSGKRAEIERVAGQLSDAIQRLTPSGAAPAPPPDETVHAKAVIQLREMHNAEEGGFSATQQFPQEGFVLYLLDHWRRTGDPDALRVAVRTLEAIAAGGIHDHVGGGFHRYTVDANWRTPHFEKMLYNQAQLSRAFIEGWEATANPAWRRAAERAFAYVLRDMTDPDGAFYSAEDADSPSESGERIEGAFYVWTPEAVRAALGRDSQEVIGVLGLEERPTIEAGPVAHLDPADPPDFERLDPLLERLRAARENRLRPLRDEKVIAGWNGLMIRALADGGVAFEQPAYVQAAAGAAEALLSRLWSDGRLMRLWAGGKAYEDGVLEDYAWVGLGLAALWDATGAEVWRQSAGEVARAALALFADGTGRLKMAAEDGPVGPVYDSADGATPSGESAMLELLARLDRRLPDPGLRAAAEGLLGALSGQLSEAPLLRPDALVAARVLEGGSGGGESALRRALGSGTIRARMVPGGARLTVEIVPGWHVNAPDPASGDLVGATLDGAEADWPEGRAVRLGFVDRPVRVYEGRLDLALASVRDVVGLVLQPCSDTVCLGPEKTAFRLR